MTRHLLALAVASALLGAMMACGSASSPAPAPSPVTANPAVDANVPGGIAEVMDSTGGTMAGCPGGNGIHISATGGTLTDSSAGTNTVIGLGESVDTTLVFDITRKTWTRRNIAAAISVGIADESRGRYSICAGVTALLPSASLTITGARGRVHFAASLADFTNTLRTPAAR